MIKTVPQKWQYAGDRGGVMRNKVGNISYFYWICSGSLYSVIRSAAKSSAWIFLRSFTILSIASLFGSCKECDRSRSAEHTHTLPNNEPSLLPLNIRVSHGRPVQHTSQVHEVAPQAKQRSGHSASLSVPRLWQFANNLDNKEKVLGNSYGHVSATVTHIQWRIYEGGTKHITILSCILHRKIFLWVPKRFPL